MTIMYFTIGDSLDMYVQAFLSIESFKRQIGESDVIVAVTTNPDFFKGLDYVKTVVIDCDTVTEWRGEHDFFWRTKIKAMERVLALYHDDDLVYLDCDTFLYGDVNEMKRLLNSGCGLMDGNDGHPSRIKYKPQKMYKKVGGCSYAGITISEKHDMWCAGVVAIPREKSRAVLEMALSICDGMLDDGAEPIVVEQYSLSVAMYENTRLTSSKPYVAHYWSNKSQWIEIAKDMMAKSILTKANFVDEIDAFIASSIKSVPVYVKKHNTNRKLKSLVDKYFGDDSQQYVEGV